MRETSRLTNSATRLRISSWRLASPRGRGLEKTSPVSSDIAILNIPRRSQNLCSNSSFVKATGNPPRCFGLGSLESLFCSSGIMNAASVAMITSIKHEVNLRFKFILQSGRSGRCQGQRLAAQESIKKSSIGDGSQLVSYPLDLFLSVLWVFLSRT